MTARRDQLIELAIISASASAAAACVVVAARVATDPGDVLGFFGGAIGAGLAVAGALWVERHKERQKAQADRDMLAQSLVLLGVTSYQAADAPDDQLDAMLRTVEQNLQNFLAVRGFARLDNGVHHGAMATIAYWAEKHVVELEAIVSLPDEPVAAKAAAWNRGRVIARGTFRTVKNMLAEASLFAAEHHETLLDCTEAKAAAPAAQR
jgi:hypothetical protein